jgi:O-antigen/teichoic acid export membrane protein
MPRHYAGARSGLPRARLNHSQRALAAPAEPGVLPSTVSRAQKLIDRARGAVPEGTFAVGVGLLIAAITSYGFVIVAFRALGNQQNAGLSAFWALIFVAGPGFFLPLEQEVGRALAHRRAQGIGGGPVVARAARLGGLLAVLLVISAGAFAVPLKSKLFHGDSYLVLGLAIGLVGFYSMHLTRGTLSGSGRFRPYGVMLAVESIVRLVGALALAAFGVNQAWAYGLCLGLAPFVAVPVSLRGQHGLLEPGPPAPYSELSEKLGYLLAGSVLMQLLGYAALLGVNLLETSHDKAAVASFTRAFFVARIPILLFQAVQAALLPKLAGLAGSGRHADFRSGLRRLLVVVTGIAVLGTVAAFTIGPFAGKILFGADKFTISNGNLALLAAGSGVYIIALTLAQALIALSGHARATVAWLVGVCVFVAVAAAVSDLFLRVELSFLIGSIASAVVMAAMLAERMRSGVPESIRPLIEAIEHEPLEL